MILNRKVNMKGNTAQACNFTSQNMDKAFDVKRPAQAASVFLCIRVSTGSLNIYNPYAEWSHDILLFFVTVFIVYFT